MVCIVREVCHSEGVISSQGVYLGPRISVFSSLLCVMYSLLPQPLCTSAPILGNGHNGPAPT